MKKFLIFLIFTLIGSAAFTATKEENNKIQPDDFTSIIPPGHHYVLYEPINRPKWAYPLAWTGYIATLGIIPFPAYLKKKDNFINENNKKFEEIVSYKNRYDNDIEKCKAAYKTDSELYKCYQDVKILYNNMLNQYYVRNTQEQALEQQKLTNYYLLQNNNNQRKSTTTNTNCYTIGNQLYCNSTSK